MAFDEVQFPPTLSLGTSGGPRFSTQVITVDGGFERRNQNWSQALRHYNVAKSVQSQTDMSTLIAFFHARAGMARGFRFKDWSDYVSTSGGTGSPAFTDQNIGTGDGSNTVFQLRKRYTSGSVTHDRSIKKPVTGSVLIGINGVQQLSGWTVDTTTGIVTFVSAPGNGLAVTAGFTFDVPVRFDADNLDYTFEHGQYYGLNVPIVEVRL